MVELYVNINILKGFFIWMSFSLATTRDGQKNPTQKNPPKKTQKKTSQKNPPKTFFLGFFENSPKIIQKEAKNPIKPDKTP